MNYVDIYNEIAESYSANLYNENYRDGRELTGSEIKMLERFCDRLLPSKSAAVLDVCCGNGILYDKYLADKKCNVTGIDISEKQIQSARKNVPEAVYIQDNFLRHLFSWKFDAIICMFGVFHFLGEDLKLAIERMYERLYMNGFALLNLRKEVSAGLVRVDDWCGRPMTWCHQGVTQLLLYATEAGFTCQVFDNPENPEYVYIWLYKV